MIIYDHKEDLRVRKSWKGRSPVQWHTDQSPEQQPPGTTFIGMLESPAMAGGDTLVSSSIQAFKALSPRFRKRLEGLTAIHSNNDGVSQELKNGSNAVMRRQELTAEHPIVRIHPVTGEKALCKLIRVCEEGEHADNWQMSTQSIQSELSVSIKRNLTTFSISCLIILRSALTSSVVCATKLAQSSCGTSESQTIHKHWIIQRVIAVTAFD